MMTLSETLPQKIFKYFNYLILTLFGASTLYPFWYFFVLSLNDGKDAVKGGIYFLPRILTLDNYKKAFENQYILNSFGISIFRTLVGTLISLILTSALAYVLTKKNLPGRTAITFYFFFTTLFSGGLIPFYIVLRQMGLTKSIWIYVIPFLYNFFFMVIMRTFFDSIPLELSEAAIIDGCNDLQILWKIYIPLSGAVLASIALFFGVTHWNDWFTGSFFISNKKLIPSATLLQEILTEASFEDSGIQTVNQYNTAMEGVKSNTTPEALRMTFLVITTVPIIFIYPFLQKHFVKGVTLGSIKG